MLRFTFKTRHNVDIECSFESILTAFNFCLSVEWILQWLFLILNFPPLIEHYAFEELWFVEQSIQCHRRFWPLNTAWLSLQSTVGYTIFFCIWEYVFPELYKFTIVCLNSLVYFVFFFPDIFMPPFLVFYFITLVHFFSIYPIDTCLTAQDRFKAYLDYFRIEYLNKALKKFINSINNEIMSLGRKTEI